MSIPDGFIKFDDAQCEPIRLAPHRFNLDPTFNEFSPFSDHKAISIHSDRSLIVDKYYGQVYDQMNVSPAAIYGRTKEFPMYSGDQLENYGYLRVPFRRIPRRLVRNRAEIEWILSSIKSADPNLKILLRGQTTEYLIKRSRETSQWLFGEDNVLEPSIASSASRRGPPLEDVIPEWMILLKMFLKFDQGLSEDEYEKFVSSYSFPLFGLALAQHYGLPTAGIDVTNNLDVALFFALMKYDNSAGDFKATYRRFESASPSVLYVLSPSSEQQFDYQGIAPAVFPIGRPKAQGAYFMHVGWGHAVNTCARRVFLALYLDPNGDFGPLPAPAALFPEGKSDRFARFLEIAATQGLPANLKKAFESGFYVVNP